MAGSSKTAPRILKFSIAMSANYSFELIFMPTLVSGFYAHSNFHLERVYCTPFSNTPKILPMHTILAGNEIGMGRSFGISNISLVITYTTVVIAALMLAGFLWMAFAYSGQSSSGYGRFFGSGRYFENYFFEDSD